MAPLVLKPAPPAAARALRACRSDFSGSLDAAFRGLSLSKPAAPAPASLRVDCARPARARAAAARRAAGVRGSEP